MKKNPIQFQSFRLFMLGKIKSCILNPNVYYISYYHDINPNVKYYIIGTILKIFICKKAFVFIMYR